MNNLENTLPTIQDDTSSTGLSTYDYSRKMVALTPEEREMYLEKASVLKTGDITSIHMYGHELSKIIADNGKPILEAVHANSSSEVVRLTNNILLQLRQVDVNEMNADNSLKKFLKNVPGVKRLIKTMDTIKVKYNTIQANVDGIKTELGKAKIKLMEDIGTLDVMYSNNVSYLKQLRELVIAAKVKLETVDAEIEDMNANLDKHEVFEIRDRCMYRDMLAKRITDLIGKEYIIYQDLHQLSIMRMGNNSMMSHCDNIVLHTIPVWQLQLAKAAMLDTQKSFATAISMTTQATNDMLVSNMKTMKENAITVAKVNQSTTVSKEALKKTTDEFISMLNELNNIQIEGAKKDAEYERFVLESREKLDSAIRRY